MDGSDPRAQKRVGAVLDEKWTLETLIGSGGMGAVYAGRHRNGARAAVKILHPELARLPDVRERFLREGYAANRVEHRGVVQVLDDDIVKTGDDEGSAYLVMELLEGESLQDRVLCGPKLTERELLEVMDAVLDVLAAAHAHGVIHRDLKPENIFLAKDPERDGVRVKVLDFGLARLAEASGVTNAGIAVGTPSFMSPEQAAGRSTDIDGRTDIFALGATVFRIVTGRRIHDADNMVQLVVLMASHPAPALRTIAPNVSESFANVVDRALTFDREERPDASTMRAIVHAALEKANPEDGGTLTVIPISARSLRVGSSADIPQKTSDPAIRSRLPTMSDAGESSPASEPSDEINPRRSGRPLAKSATLPWLIVLLLLAIGAWKLGPSLQEELVKRGSVWASASPTTAASAATTATTEPDPEPASSALPASDHPPDAGAAITLDDDADEADAGDPAAPTPSATVAEPSPTAPRDAGAAHAVAARPHNDRPPTSHTAAKPPAKKPPQPPQQPPRKRRH